MSAIGRVFIVLNLLLSGAFLAYSGMYLKNHDHFKQKYTAAVADHDKAVKALNDQLAASTQDVERRKVDIAQLENQKANKDTEITSLRNENTGLKGRLNALQKTVEGVEASMSSVSTTLGNQNTRLTQLTDKWLAADKAQKEAIAARNDMENKLNAAQAALAKSKSREEALIGENNEKADAIAKLDLELTAYTKKFGNLGEVLPKVDGRIATVNASLKTVSITLGENQAGTKAGWSFAVHDGNTYKGQIVIERVSDNVAFGRISKVVPGQSISAGDVATTKLGN